MEQRFLLLTHTEQAASKVTEAMHGHGQREAANEHFWRQSLTGFSFPSFLSFCADRHGHGWAPAAEKQPGAAAFPGDDGGLEPGR